MRGSVFALALLQILWFAPGCTHIQLRKHASQQHRTTTDLVQQQVMDNIAKLAADPSAWPQYSGIAEGVTQLTDLGEGTAGLKWNARSIVEESLGLKASRALQENWRMQPVNDASRLRAMWAVYHHAIYGTLPPPTYGYDARTQFRDLFGEQYEQMLPGPGWFRITCEKERIEKVYCGCVVGRYCNTRAYVLPGYEYKLQQLTFLIQHMATATYTVSNGASVALFPTGMDGVPDGVEQDGTQESVGRGSRFQLGPSLEFRSGSGGIEVGPFN
jgi:hypothetical protein